jgi:dTDP-4-dehydrorhamnose reductase
MLRLAAQRDMLQVVDDQLGAPSFADDLAAAVARMAPRLIRAGSGDEAFGTFHLTGAPHASWHGFALAILDAAAARGHRAPPLRPITTAEFPTLARRPADSRLDCRRIREVHGIAQPDWRAGLARSLNILVGPRRDVAPVRRASEGVPA